MTNRKKVLASILGSIIASVLVVAAFMAARDTAADADSAMYIDEKGNVGFGTLKPGSPLSVSGGATVGDHDFVEKNAAPANGLLVQGNVGIGSPSPRAPLDVAGNAAIGGALSVGELSAGRVKGPTVMAVRYQRDDDPETTFEKPLQRYHLSITAAKYAGTSKTIPRDVLVGLCGTPDGCEIRLGMTRWDDDKETETASRSVRFYFSAKDGRWRVSGSVYGSLGPWQQSPPDALGISGDGARQDALNIWNTCFFSDAQWDKFRELGDKGSGMQLLLWNTFKGATRTCELTIIP